MGRGIMPSVKWAVLVVVVILVAPTIAKRLEALDPERAEQRQAAQRRGGLLYRAVRRFGPARVFAAFALLVVILAVVAYVLVKNV